MSEENNNNNNNIVEEEEENENESSSSSSSSRKREFIRCDLIIAAQTGNFEQVKYLVEKENVDVNQIDEYGDTALHLSCNFSKIINYLLKHNADPNIQNQIGSTPLHRAALKSELQIVKQLLKHKADPNIKNKSANLPSDLTSMRNIKVALFGEDVSSQQMKVDKKYHKNIIGRGGSKLQQIQRESNTIITVPQMNDNSKGITIQGKPENIEKAKELINQIVKPQPLNWGNEDFPDLNAGRTILKCPFPKDTHRIIVGKGGKNLREIENEFDVELRVPSANDNEDVVVITGKNDEDVHNALKRVNEVISNTNQNKNFHKNKNKNNKKNDNVIRANNFLPIN
eukprot:TRINITY_DN491_c7_g1_i1.p1 TRINITY_DN491_c7_g1~~TRINITY_DN491_c7_g1_i1.p1  ORF type:complete len:341 (+),score=139.50 TRINITY_DN491_c7_g1_i1:90-1112(+)